MVEEIFDGTAGFGATGEPVVMGKVVVGCTWLLTCEKHAYPCNYCTTWQSEHRAPDFRIARVRLTANRGNR